MKVGPFSTENAEKVKAALLQAEISFEVLVNEEAVSKRNKHSQLIADTEILGGPDAAIFFEINEADQDAFSGIVSATLLESEEFKETGTELLEEFYCAECEYRSDSQGVCPKHKLPLVAFEVLSNTEREMAIKAQSSALSLILKIGGLVVFLYLLWRARHSLGF